MSGEILLNSGLVYYATFDYELFGSGKGDVRKNLIEPTDAILEVLTRHNIKATFFVEQIEVEAILSLKKSFSENTDEYKNAVALEKQLITMVELGHDLQLHLHPQWFGARYIGGEWKLNFKWWRFSDLPYRSTECGIPGKFDLVKAGKKWMEDFVRKLDPQYRCNAFRAGGYNIGNDVSSLRALADNGIELDSSVCTGYFSNTALSQYDFTIVEGDKCFWVSDESLLKPSLKRDVDNGCIELPLITSRSTFYMKMSMSRIYSFLRNYKYKKVSYRQSLNARVPINVESIKNTNYDLCLSSYWQIRDLERVATSRCLKGFNPVVLIGHPKDYSVFSPLNNILTSNASRGSFETISDFLRRFS